MDVSGVGGCGWMSVDIGGCGWIGGCQRVSVDWDAGGCG